MLSKRYESTEVDGRTWLHVPSETHWSTSSDTHQVVEIQIEKSGKSYGHKLCSTYTFVVDLFLYCYERNFLYNLQKSNALTS